MDGCQADEDDDLVRLGVACRATASGGYMFRMSDKGVQRLCETRQTEQRRKRRVWINLCMGCFAFSLWAAPAHASKERVCWNRDAHLNVPLAAELLRSECRVFIEQREREKQEDGVGERDCGATQRTCQYSRISIFSTVGMCLCGSSWLYKNEGWEKKGIGKGRGKWVGRAQNTPLRHPHNIGGQNHVRMIQYEFSWRIQNCWKHYCKFAVVWLKGLPNFWWKLICTLIRSLVRVQDEPNAS